MLVSVSMQWRLQPQALIPLYSILGNDLYKDEFVRFARSAIVDACSKYQADNFFTNRTIIKAEMIERLSDNFNQPARGLEAHASKVEINDVQLREVEVAEAEREEQRIAMEREIMVATEKAVSNAEILQNFENDTDPFSRLFDIMKIKAIRDHSDTKLLIYM